MDNLDNLLNLGAFPNQALLPRLLAGGFPSELAVEPIKINKALFFNELSVFFGSPWVVFQTIWSGRHHSSKSAAYPETLYGLEKIPLAIH
ncbi:MAG: hypothetical protein ABSH49_06580 [Bryobacteraceae bacterium]